MTYAPQDRVFYDADSHIMELPDFLRDYADPAIRDEIPQVSYSASLVTDAEVAQIMAQGGRHSDAHIASMVAMGGTQLIEKAKENQAHEKLRVIKLFETNLNLKIGITWARKLIKKQ